MTIKIPKAVFVALGIAIVLGALAYGATKLLGGPDSLNSADDKAVACAYEDLDPGGAHCTDDPFPRSQIRALKDALNDETLSTEVPSLHANVRTVLLNAVEFLKQEGTGLESAFAKDADELESFSQSLPK